MFNNQMAINFLALIIIIPVCLLVGRWVYLAFFHTRQTPRLLRDVQESRIRLQKSTLESRAVPNERIAEIFNIDNALTTRDPDYRLQFKRDIVGKLVTPAEEWETLTIAASNFCGNLFMRQETHGDKKLVQLVPLVQSLVFRMALLKFFPQIPQPSQIDVEFITTSINSLWLATKDHPTQVHANILGTKKELERRIRKIFEKSPTDQMDGRANPLNIIVPAYETLWRVVLRCFLEVRFRTQGKDDQGGVENIDYVRIFASFMSTPNRSAFGALFLDTQISIKHIVDEALRLYPPTRRIHRQEENELVKIDVEWLHRDPVSWGSDAEEFRPERWECELLKDMNGKSAFIPFSLGHFSCPAKSFAPMMIGILVGVMFAGDGEKWELIDGRTGGDVLGARVLDGGREAYAGLWLRKIEI
jgi:hypothetical protein